MPCLRRLRVAVRAYERPRSVTTQLRDFLVGSLEREMCGKDLELFELYCSESYVEILRDAAEGKVGCVLREIPDLEPPYGCYLL